MSKTIDKAVYLLAQDFVDDTIRELGLKLTGLRVVGFYQKAAKAMQQAIEDECEAIRQELQNG